MKVIWPKEGKHVLAVSGGADSMALLHLLCSAAAKRGYDLVVAHFDHGLRPDSGADRRLVEAAAAGYQVPFAYHEAHLGQASEAGARAARYAWLAGVKAGHHADQVVTAHHQDDLIETSLLNLARGTGRRGLSPLGGADVLRPLVAVSRAELREYAAAHKLLWREDSTNADTTNPRNFLRHRLLTQASGEWRRAYLENVEKMASLNKSIGQSLAAVLTAHRAEPSGYSFPHEFVRYLSLTELAELILAAAQALQPGVEPGARNLRELALFAKTGAPGRFRELVRGLRVAITPQAVLVERSLPPTKTGF
jgi:tRNA(Ile)-lysidine synthetase-like protein